MLSPNRLNIGCGTDIRHDCINLDVAPLPGANVVHDLNKFPWPLEDNSFKEIFMINTLEHLPNTVRVMEELHRISEDGCIIHIRVPYWNSFISYSDPTHLRTFHQNSFDFFDPATDLGERRSYYSKAKFKILEKYYWMYLKFGRRERYFKIKNPTLKKILEILSLRLCNIIYLIEFDLKALKKSTL